MFFLDLEHQHLPFLLNLTLKLQDDSRKNKRIKRAKDDIEKTIGGILVANNFVNILMASLATILFVRSFGESTGSILATLFITILVLIFGEVTPKTIATRKPVEFLSRTSLLIDYLARIFAPFTNLITNSINRYCYCWEIIS